MPSNPGTGDHRRVKSAAFLFACGCAGAAPHWLDPLRSLWPAISLAMVLGGYGLRTVLSGELKRGESSSSGSVDPDRLPSLDVVVAARDEEGVVTRLVERLQSLRYPVDRLSTWVIDDGSLDRTPQLLDQLAKQHPGLNVIHRPRNAGGGKSGALNTALAQLRGEWLLVLDADAQLQEDLLERLVPYALDGGWSAVQLRKAVVDADSNWLTRSQAMEMALDAVIQNGRLAEEVAEPAQRPVDSSVCVEESGGFNEDTVTDDLDLSFRLLTHGALVGMPGIHRCRRRPARSEGAVETAAALGGRRFAALLRLLAHAHINPADPSSTLGSGLLFPAAVRLAGRVVCRSGHQCDQPQHTDLLAAVDRGLQHFGCGLLARLSGSP